MKDITVSVDDETYRLTCVKAEQAGISVSALVRNCLRGLVRDGPDGAVANVPGVETELERRRRLLNEVIADFKARGVGLRMADNLPREALYDRNALR